MDAIAIMEERILVVVTRLLGGLSVPMNRLDWLSQEKYIYRIIAILFLKERVINFDHFASIRKLTRKHVRIGNMYYRLLEKS
jgi:hypothetical protein